MKKKLLLPLFALFILSTISLNAQSNIEIQCQMTIDEIALDQSYHIDDPKQEETRIIASTIISELNLIYNKVNSNTTVGLVENIENVKSAILASDQLGMNHSMFDADMEFIESLN